MKRICIMTATRAEYGLLSTLIKKLFAQPEFDIRVVVTGMHLSPEFGLTYKEIENDGICIDKKIEMLLSSDTSASVTKSMGVALIGFADYFAEVKPDALIVLGDRYETLAVCIAAMNEQVPIFHIHGGEATEGLIDEAIRHSITKMSYLHFTSTDIYRYRVIQLGEEPCRVFNVGALGVENVLNCDCLTKEELEKDLGIKLGRCFALGTYHPVTLEKDDMESQIDALLKAIEKHPEITFLFTKANADQNGRYINSKLSSYAERHKNLYLLDSLGLKRYLSAVKYAKFVIGNSSSGLIEIPSFHIPTIDIGNRQRGRVAGRTIIHCEATSEQIEKAIDRALDQDFIEDIKNAENPYGKGDTSKKIVEIIRKTLLSGNINIKKNFFDLSKCIKDYENTVYRLC